MHGELEQAAQQRVHGANPGAKPPGPLQKKNLALIVQILCGFHCNFRDHAIGGCNDDPAASSLGLLKRYLEGRERAKATY